MDMQKRERLSPQQEIFCRQIVSGKSQYEAFLNAYPKSRSWKRASVDAKASHLAAQGKIKARKEELLKAAEQKPIALKIYEVTLTASGLQQRLTFIMITQSKRRLTAN